MNTDSGAGFIAGYSPFFSRKELERIEEAALRIIEEVGIRVLEEELPDELASRGFRSDADGRIRIDRKTVAAFLEREREDMRREREDMSRKRSEEEGEEEGEEGDQLSVYVSPYPQRVHLEGTERVVPFTVERLVRATRLLHVLDVPGVPGYPADVVPPLQPVVQYWVSACHSRLGRGPVDAKSVVSLPYIMEMAEILGRPIEALPVYVFTPFNLGGESMRAVLRFRDRISRVSVGSMPSLGSTVPLKVGHAFAAAAAEIIGSTILIRELVELPVDWHISGFPADMRSLCMVFGSPESLLLQLASSEVDAFFHGVEPRPAAGNIHTNACLPGVQACVEKTNIMTVGALLGNRLFGAVGTLSLDEVFSPEQLLYDLEIKNHVQRVLRGFDGGCSVRACLEDVKEGLKTGSFLGLGSTLEGWADFYWRPGLFRRDLLSARETEELERPRDEARVRVSGLLEEHDYELEPDTRGELWRVVERAKVEL